MNCQNCGHPLDQHGSWSAGNVSGAECWACLFVKPGVYASTGGPLGHAFVPPTGYSVTLVPSAGGVAQKLVLTSSLVVA